MEESDFKLFIKLWVEDVLKRGVTTINKSDKVKELKVEDVLKKGKELR
jgi:hypothetical protein